VYRQSFQAFVVTRAGRRETLKNLLDEKQAYEAARKKAQDELAAAQGEQQRLRDAIKTAHAETHEAHLSYREPIKRLWALGGMLGGWKHLKAIGSWGGDPDGLFRDHMAARDGDGPTRGELKDRDEK